VGPENEGSVTATEAYSTPYLDTSVYIAAIKGPTTEDPNRVQVSAQVLTEAESGRLRIIASTFIHAEVIRDRGEQAPLDPAKETIIDGFFQRSFISWVELDVTGGRLARRLSRRFAIKPPDAVHIAAAIRGKADVFFTWDDRLIGAVSGDVDGLAVCQPYVYQAAQPQLDLFAAPVEMGGTDGKEEPPAELAEGE